MCILPICVHLIALSIYFTLQPVSASDSSDEEDNAAQQLVTNEPKYLRDLQKSYTKDVLAPEQSSISQMLDAASPYLLLTSQTPGAKTEGPMANSPRTTNQSDVLASKATTSANQNKRQLNNILVSNALDYIQQIKSFRTQDKQAVRQEKEDLKIVAYQSLIHTFNDALAQVSEFLQILKGPDARDWVREQISTSTQAQMTLPELQLPLHQFMIQFDLEHTYGLLLYLRDHLYPLKTPASLNINKLKLMKSFKESGTSLDKYAEETEETKALREAVDISRAFIPAMQCDSVENPPKRARAQQRYAYYHTLNQAARKILDVTVFTKSESLHRKNIQDKLADGLKELQAQAQPTPPLTLRDLVDISAAKNQMPDKQKANLSRFVDMPVSEMQKNCPGVTLPSVPGQLFGDLPVLKALEALANDKRAAPKEREGFAELATTLELFGKKQMKDANARKGKAVADLVRESHLTHWDGAFKDTRLAQAVKLHNKACGVTEKDFKNGSSKQRFLNRIDKKLSQKPVLDDATSEFLKDLRAAAAHYEVLQLKLSRFESDFDKILNGHTTLASGLLNQITPLREAVRQVEFLDFKVPARRLVFRTKNDAFDAYLNGIEPFLKSLMNPISQATQPPAAKSLSIEQATVAQPSKPMEQPTVTQPFKPSAELKSPLPSSGKSSFDPNNNNAPAESVLPAKIIDPYDTYDPLQLHAFHQERKKTIRSKLENETSATPASLKAMEMADQDYRETFHNFLRTIHLTSLKMHLFESEIKGRGFTLEITQTGNGSQCRVFPAPHNPIFGEDDYYKRAYFTFHIVHGSKDSVIPHAYLKQIRNGFASVFGLYER